MFYRLFINFVNIDNQFKVVHIILSENKKSFYYYYYYYYRTKHSKQFLKPTSETIVKISRKPEISLKSVAGTLQALVDCFFRYDCLNCKISNIKSGRSYYYISSISQRGISTTLQCFSFDYDAWRFTVKLSCYYQRCLQKAWNFVSEEFYSHFFLEF